MKWEPVFKVRGWDGHWRRHRLDLVVSGTYMLVQFINLLPENPGQISVLYTRESQEVQQSLLQFLVGKELVADQGLLEAQALVD